MSLSSPKSKRRFQPMRRLALLFLAWGVGSEAVVISGMILGILAGVSFMATSESFSPKTFWALGLCFCLARIACSRLDTFMTSQSSRESLDEVSFNELPERVSDAVTLIGFGFAADSNPFLGLAAALTAIISAYMRSVGAMRGRRKSNMGPMTRIHRLVLISATSFLMLLGIRQDAFNSTVPQIALWVIIVGCVATALIRWLNLKDFDAG